MMIPFSMDVLSCMGFNGFYRFYGFYGDGAAHQIKSAAKFSKPLPLGKGPPAGQGIGRRVRRQFICTFGTDYVMRLPFLRYQTSSL